MTLTIKIVPPPPFIKRNDVHLSLSPTPPTIPLQLIHYAAILPPYILLTHHI